MKGGESACHFETPVPGSRREAPRAVGMDAAAKAKFDPKMSSFDDGTESIRGGRPKSADADNARIGGSGWRRLDRIWSLLTLCMVLVGCELEGVAAPPADDILVVEAVLRAGASQQHILLHRSLEGDVVRGEPGARVVVTSASGLAVTYQEVDREECLLGDPSHWEPTEHLDFQVTCYQSPAEAGRFVVPGETYDLRIESVRGEILRGRTTVPQLFRFVVPAVQVSPASLEVACLLPTHPFTMTWTRSEGAWAYITSLRISLADWIVDLQEAGVEVPDPLDLSGVSVSAADTSLLFPANLGLFQRFSLDQRVLLTLQDGLPPSGNAEVAIVAADRNYVNWVRGGRFNPSGSVRGSSIAGDGVGVFGSIVPLVIQSLRGPGSDRPGNLSPPCPVPATN